MNPVQQDHLSILIAEGKTLAWRDRDGEFNPISRIAEVDGEPVALFADAERCYASLLSALEEDFFIIAQVFPS